jgi:hypothetical protein
VSFVAEYVTTAESLAAGTPVTAAIQVTLTVDEDVVRQTCVGAGRVLLVGRYPSSVIHRALMHHPINVVVDG